MNDPAVSVILPAYNRAATLGRAISSVLAQDGAGDLELIVVDDASTDTTPDVVRTFEDPRIRYHRRPQNGGASAARNTGLALARGQFISFIDSDDEWLPQKLHKELSALRAAGPETGLVLCALIRWDTRQAYYVPDPRRRTQRDKNLRREILRQNFALTSTWCVRRECFGVVGPFNESLSCLVDWEWLIRCTDSYKIMLIDEPLVMVYESPDSISNNQAGYIRSLDTLIANHEKSLVSEPQALSNLYYVLGKKHALYQSTTEAREKFLRALSVYPWDWRIWGALILTIAGAGAFASIWKVVRRSKGYKV